MKFKPRDYQQIGIDHILRNPRAALFAQPGMGKTSMALTAVDMLRLIDTIDLTLVVVPKRVLDTEGWQRELNKWDHLGDLAIQPISGPLDVRRTQLRSPKPIHLINFELLPWLLEELVHAWPYDMVIVDEATKIKGHDSTWFCGNPRSKDLIPFGSKLYHRGRQLIVGPDTPTKLPGTTTVRRVSIEGNTRPPAKQIEFLPTPGLKHVATQTAHWLNMTGTPIPNGVQDLWSPTYLLDGGERLGKNISRFREEYMKPHPYVRHQWVPQRDALERVIPKVQDICLSLKAADYFDLPELVPNVIAVPLEPEVMAQYRHLEKQFYLSLEGNTVEAVNAAVLSNKLLQFTSGAMYTNAAEDEWTVIHDARIDALRELSDEVGGPMLVAYHYDFNYRRVMKALPGAVQFDGTRGMIDAFCRGDIRHLLIQPQSAGHGIDGLQDGTDTLAFFDGTWSLEDHDQVIERIGPTRQLQSGHPRPVFVHYLATPGTVDDLLLERLIEKKTTQEIFMDAVKRRKQQ